jgi:hypothetical protein
MWIVFIISQPKTSLFLQRKFKEIKGSKSADKCNLFKRYPSDYDQEKTSGCKPSY